MRSSIALRTATIGPGFAPDALGADCRSGDIRPALARVALFILFFGEGMAITVQYFVAYFSWDLPDWLVSRYNLLVTLPALLVGIPCYVEHKGLAKSAPVVCCVLWMAASLSWTDPTEWGRGMLALAGIATTLPTAALIVRTDLHEECSLWLCASFMTSVMLAVLLGMESVGGRFGDVVEGDAIVMNSNGVGCSAALLLLLIYRMYETRRRGAKSQPGRLSNRVYTIYLPALALGAAVLVGMSVSRTAAIALAAPLLIILVWNIGRGNAIAVRISLFLGLLGSLLFIADFIAPWLERFGNDEIGTFNGRTDIWESGWELASRLQFNWVHGLGLGGLDKFLGDATGYGVVHPIDGILRCHSHNQYLEWMLELGLVGTVLGMWLVREMVRAAWRLDWGDRTIHRRALLLYFALLGLAAGVVTKSETWPAVGPLLWAILTPRRQEPGERKTHDCQRHARTPL